jgi:hypothetical protein
MEVGWRGIKLIFWLILNLSSSNETFEQFKDQYVYFCAIVLSFPLAKDIFSMGVSDTMTRVFLM